MSYVINLSHVTKIVFLFDFGGKHVLLLSYLKKNYLNIARRAIKILIILKYYLL